MKCHMLSVITIKTIKYAQAQYNMANKVIKLKMILNSYTTRE